MSNKENRVYYHACLKRNPNGNFEDMYRYGFIKTVLGPKIYLERYEILRTTPSGVWVVRNEGWCCDKKEWFVNLGAKKRRCYETKKLALESFIARKKRQVCILRNDADIVERAVELATELMQAHVQCADDLGNEQRRKECVYVREEKQVSFAS